MTTTTKGKTTQEVFWSERIVVHLDCGGVHTTLFVKNHRTIHQEE